MEGVRGEHREADRCNVSRPIDRYTYRLMADRETGSSTEEGWIYDGKTPRKMLSLTYGWIRLFNYAVTTACRLLLLPLLDHLPRKELEEVSSISSYQHLTKTDAIYPKSKERGAWAKGHTTYCVVHTPESSYHSRVHSKQDRWINPQKKSIYRRNKAF